MKKVLIISYFFPPNNFTASNRAYSFAKHLSIYDYYPIVISRNWDFDIRGINDSSLPSGKTIIHNKKDNYEIYYLPYYGSLRDKFQQLFKKRFSFIRKTLSLFELILENFGLFFISYSDFYYKAKEIIAKEDIEYLIISASPFHQFYFGYLLKKDFPKLKWIADYRDEWTSRTLVNNSSFLQKKILKLQEKREKKWVRTANKIISVSDVVVNNIAKHIGVEKYDVIENGFFEDDYHLNNLSENINNNTFIITYTGEIYEKQDFSIFLFALKKNIIEFSKDIDIKIQFIGINGQLSQKDYILKHMKGFEQNIIFTERVPRKECVVLELNSDLLLMVAYGSLKGIPSSKLYQYIGSKKPIFLCPSDNDIIEATLIKTNQAIIASTKEDAYTTLNAVIKNKNNKIELNTDVIQKYSRKHQTKKLAKILNSL